MTDRKKIREIIEFTYQKQRDNADLWYRQSVSFHEASIVLDENKGRIHVRVFQFNAAISLELIFKAILVAKGKKLRTIHNLRELCKETEIALDEDQMLTLDLLTEGIIWLGRYPVPTSEEKWDNFQENIYAKQKVTSRSGNTGTVSANPKRFPSMDNYTRIWGTSLAQYADIK